MPLQLFLQQQQQQQQQHTDGQPVCQPSKVPCHLHRSNWTKHSVVCIKQPLGKGSCAWKIYICDNNNDSCSQYPEIRDYIEYYILPNLTLVKYDANREERVLFPKPQCQRFRMTLLHGRSKWHWDNLLACWPKSHLIFRVGNVTECMM